MREVYGSSFFLVALHENEKSRRRSLEGRIGIRDKDPETKNKMVQCLLDRDRGRQYASDLCPGTELPPSKARLSIEKVFELADVIVPASSDEAESQCRRFVWQLMSYPFSTPTVDEIGMACASTAALRSGAIARRVGASIVSQEGDLLCIGYNDAPAPGGGHYVKDGFDGYKDAWFVRNDTPMERRGNEQVY